MIDCARLLLYLTFVSGATLKWNNQFRTLPIWRLRLRFALIINKCNINKYKTKLKGDTGNPPLLRLPPAIDSTLAARLHPVWLPPAHCRLRRCLLSPELVIWEGNEQDLIKWGKKKKKGESERNQVEAADAFHPEWMEYGGNEMRMFSNYWQH